MALKTIIDKDLEKSAHTWIWIFLYQFLILKNIPRKTRESLLMLLPTCAFHVILMHTWPMHIACDSHACGLCTSRVVLVLATCVIPMSFLYTLDLLPNDSFLCLGIEMVEILRVEARVFSLDRKWRMTRPKNLKP